MGFTHREGGSLTDHDHDTSSREDADATLKITRSAWDEIVTKRSILQAKLLAGEVDIDGSRLALLGFFTLLDDFEPDFPIVEP